jgi:hypothetical protein
VNIAEFEAQLTKPLLVPKIMLVYQTLTHQIEYTPEDFLMYIHQGSNTEYSVNKQKTGAGIYKYSVITLTGGYILTTVSDQVQTGSGVLAKIMLFLHLS